ncbi:MAG: hypothetical protein ACK5ME_04475, partial [Parahaliea sp.]
DASFKQYDFTAGYDLQAEVPFDAQALVDDIEASATINETEGWVQNVPQTNIESQLAAYQQQLEDYITNQNPDATVGEVLGLQEITILPPQPLAAGLPYQLVSRSQAFSTVPDNIKHRFEYTLSTENLGSEGARLITISKSTAEIAGKGLSVSFRPSTQADEDIIASYIPEPDPDTGEINPADLPGTLPGYLINLTAEFTVEGEVTASAPSGTMGETLYETIGLYSPAKGWRRASNFPIAGEYRAIGVDLQGSSPEQAARMQERMEATKTILESGDEVQLATLTKQQVVGDLMEGTIFSYFALNNVQDEIAAQSSNVTAYRVPSYGMFRTDIVPSYWFGIPRDVSFSGLVMDVDLVAHMGADKQNRDAEWLGFNQSIGARYSAMEHLVPEQMFSTEENPAEGVSAVKALAIAGAEGQRIYTIDQNNLTAALAAIELDSTTEAEIYNAVIAGNVVTTHQYQINFHGWIGAGYIILDPDMGSGAYKISGGENGCELIITDEDGKILLFETLINSILDIFDDFKSSPFKSLGKLLKVMSTIGVIIDIFGTCGGLLERVWLLFGFLQSSFIAAFAVGATLLFFGPIAAFVVGIIAGILVTAVMNYLMCTTCSRVEGECE